MSKERDYIGLYIDILGQKEVLRNQAETCEKKYSPVDHFICKSRKTLNALKRKTKKSIQKHESKKEKDPENYKRYAEYMTKLSLSIETFSDSIVIYAPLDCSDSILHAGLLKYIFTIISTMQIASLVHTIPYTFRGSIEIGKAAKVGMDAKHKSGCIYGPLFMELASIEQEAKYPIVAIGRRLRKELAHTLERGKVSTFVDDANRQLAEACEKLKKPININDADGLHFVDFICCGIECAKLIGKREEFLKDIKKGYCWINQQISRIDQANAIMPSEDLRKLRQKYDWLREYFDRNKEKWS